MNNLFEIIYEDDGLLVVNKPAGLVCHPTKGDEFSSLISRVRLHLGDRASPHLVNRLDRETSGVTIVAKNAEVAGELGRLWETRTVEKEYLAIVHGHVRDEHGLIDAPLGKDEQSLVAVKDCVRPDGAASQTEFWVERRFHHPRSRPPPRKQEFEDEGRGREGEQKTGEQFSLSARKAGGEGRGEVGASELSTPRSVAPKRSEGGSTSESTLLRIVPRTGRKHQIRIHLAHIGHPIVGDKLYGGDEDLYLALVQNRLSDEQRRRLILPNQALHARTLRFTWRGRQLEFSCNPESWFTEFSNRG